MQRNFFKLFLLVLALPLLGAGCVQIKTAAGDAGVFTSKDGGSKWEHKVFVRQEEKKTITIAGEDVVAFASHPKNPSIIYIGTSGSGVYRTENAGDQWSQFLPFKGRTYAIAVNPKDAKNIVVAVGERVLRTRDEGKQWEIAYLETRSKVFAQELVFDSFDPRKIYLALSNGDLLRSDDGGTSWALLYHAESAILKVLVQPKDTRIITIMTRHHGLYRTTDLGKEWKSLQEGLNRYSGSTRGQALVSDPRSTNNLFYLSDFGLLETADGGASWREVKLLVPSSTAPATAFALAPSNANVIYYTTTSALYRSRDHGKTWTTTPLPTAKRPSLLVTHPTNEQIIFMGVERVK